MLIDTLSAPALQQPADVLDGAHAAADGERHEAALGRALDDVEDGVAVLVAGRDVEEAELVGAGRVIGGGGLDRIAGIDEVDEVDALDDAAVLDVEAGDDAGFEHVDSQPQRAAMRAQRFVRIEAAVVERAAGDGAFEHRILRPQQRLHVVDRGEAAGGDDRNARRARQLGRRFEVEPFRTPSRSMSV